MLALGVLFVAGIAWGAAWKRSAALVDVASFLPILLLLVGPGALVVFLGYRGATGQLWARIVGYATIAALAGAVIGNLGTPDLPSSVDVGGRVNGTLDGVTVDAAGTCTWGPGRTAVIRIRSPLPHSIGQPGTAFSPNLPAGTLNIELPSGSVTLTDIADTSMPAALPLRNGSGNVGTGDRTTGSLTLDPAQRDVVAGQLSWTCDAAPTP